MSEPTVKRCCGNCHHLDQQQPKGLHCPVRGAWVNAWDCCIMYHQRREVVHV
jgi:hypothetical protein